MSTNKPIARPTLKSIASYVRKHALQVKNAQHHHHEASTSVREADYEGHHIVIRTTYEIQVDGVPITGHVGVTEDGQVHYHPVPNVSFASALDLVKQLIDVFPDDFTGAAPHGGHMRKAQARSKSTAQKRRVKKMTARRT